MTLTRIVLESSTSAAKSWKMISFLFGVNFFLALIFAFGFRSDLRAGFGDSLLPERLMQGFDATVYNDFLRTCKHLLTPFWGQLFWLILFSFGLNTLFGGGIIKGLSRGESSFSVAEFLADCGEYVLRLLLLLLISAVGLFLIGLVWFFVSGIFYSLLSSGATTETPYVTAFIITALVFLIPMITLLMIVDYTKVAIVLDNERSPFRALWTGTKFVFRNFFAATLWQWLMIIVALVLMFLYLYIEGNIGIWLGVFLLFLLQQLSIGGKIWVKLTTIGGQILLFARKQGAPALAVGFVPPAVEALPPVPTTPARMVTGRPVKRAKTVRRTRIPKRKR